MKTLKRSHGQKIAESFFRHETVQNLNSKGITLIGTVCVPDEHGNFSQTAYQVDDNGTFKIWPYMQVLDAAVLRNQFNCIYSD